MSKRGLLRSGRNARLGYGTNLPCPVIRLAVDRHRSRCSRMPGAGLASSPILPTSRERRFSMSQQVDVAVLGMGPGEVVTISVLEYIIRAGQSV